MLAKEGLIKCAILHPKRLYHPVILFRCNNKLLHSLCRTCAIEQNTASECEHETVAERALVGTWVIDEVRLAVEKGYRVNEVIELYEYNVTQYDPTTGEGRLLCSILIHFWNLRRRRVAILAGLRAARMRIATSGVLAWTRASSWIRKRYDPTLRNVP
jgi:hypothetical protein